VLWLLNTSKPVREAIAGYFRDPAGTAGKLGTSTAGPGAQVVVAKDDMSKLKEELEKAISHMPNFDKLKDQIEITVTPEGLRIELLESATGTFFDLGSSTPNQNGKELLDLLAGELGKLPNKISIEGHTDSKPYSGKRNYGNWELSTDRQCRATTDAAAAFGTDAGCATPGVCDHLVRKAENPFDPSNRRISLIVQYTDRGDAAEGRTAQAVEKVAGKQ
jgi:chemotaxis protein MotB